MTHLDQQDRFMRVLATGELFSQQEVCDYIMELQSRDSWGDVVYFRRDSGETYQFLYDNEVYLFVLSPRTILVRNDSENRFNSDAQATFIIKTQKDIDRAYNTFKSMTQEGDFDD